MYIQWLYGRKIFSRPTEAEGNEDSSYGELSLLVDAFVFGEKVQDGDFKDAVIDAVIASINVRDKTGECWYPCGSTVDRAYEGTPDGSPLRRLMVDIHVHHGGRQWLDGVTSVDFLKDLAGDLYIDRDTSMRSNPTNSRLKSCGYHQHSESLPCYSVAM